MPLKGFVCPPWSPTSGNRNEVTYCLGACPHPCVCPPLLGAIHQAEQQNHHKGAYLSASMLAGALCPRQTLFERRHEFYENPTRRWWPFRGTHAHSLIEKAGSVVEPYGWLQELRMVVRVEYPEHPAPIMDADGNFTGVFDRTKPLVIEVGGTTDAYNPRIRELWDFKSMADAKVDMFVKGNKGGTHSPNLEDRWVVQLNIYRWLTANTRMTPKQRRALGLTGTNFPAPERLGIQAVGMMGIPRSGADYQLKARGTATTYTIDEVPVWELDKIEAYVREHAHTWYRWLILGETPPVVAKDMDWLCKGCAFNGDLIPGERCRPQQERTVTEDVPLELVA
jgi:hypothetical protein